MGSVVSLQEWREKQEKLSKLKSPSEANIPWEELGLVRTEVTNRSRVYVYLHDPRSSMEKTI